MTARQAEAECVVSAPGRTATCRNPQNYNNLTIAFDADFDAGTVAIGDVTVTLKGVNAILIDRVERADARAMSTKLSMNLTFRSV